MSLSQVYADEDTAWHNFTDYVDGLQEIELDWSTSETITGTVPTGEFAPKRAVSGELTFERDAMTFIRSHLVDDVAASLNEIEVMITDISIGRYINYIIESDDLNWCEYNALCTFNITLKQPDAAIKCIERTLIADNWNGWFENEPIDVSKTTVGGTPVKKYHPRFSYCIEKRPNGTLILEWVLTSFLAIITTLVYTVLYPILFTIYSVISIINDIITAINTVPGISLSTIPNPMPAPPTDVLDGWANMMLEAAGCGREHPAPLIRDYISNVCDKCGVLYDAQTADIFFAPFLTITHSDGLEYTEPNPHYNACYFFPSVTRGVRRYRNWNLLTGFSLQDTTTFYQPENAPVLALSDLLDQLKKPYNARWTVRSKTNPATGNPAPYLFFKRKDFYTNQVPILDFSKDGKDRSAILKGICYTQSEIKLAASLGALYDDDPSDKCGHEASHEYNGDPYSFGNSINDPHFFGILEKKSGFAAAKFNCDGASTNYLYDALQVCYSTSILGGILTTFVYGALSDFIAKYADYALLLQTEQVSLPKLLIWDGKMTSGPILGMDARCIRDEISINGTIYKLGHTAYDLTVSGINSPHPNPLYPVLSHAPDSLTLGSFSAPAQYPVPAPFNQWHWVNQVKTFVWGRISGARSPDGIYEVIDYFGTSRLANAAILVNWPAYFTPYFKGTLWDNFHWIDDPVKNPQSGKKWSVQIPLCKEYVDALSLTEDITAAKLLHTVLLDTPFYNIGVITDIHVSYRTGSADDENNVGQYIEIKGYV